MFGSTNTFGQPSSSPFGSQSVFGSNNGSNNPFTPNPFGSPSLFGSQTGPIFGGTSTGVFGATQSSSPLASTPAFGAPSTPAFGSSVPAFGTSSTPAFGSSVFGQKPAFGGFGSTTTQTNPFGSTNQQTQSAFGSNLFSSSTPFGASSQPSTPFGASSQPAFGSTNAPTFGMTGTPTFGSTGTSPFGSTSTPAFGSTSTSAFGSTGTSFNTSNAPAFGSGGVFGVSSAPVFGSSTTSVFGAPSTPAFGSSSSSLFGGSSSAFGAPSSPSFNFGSSPSFGQSSSAFGSSSPFGTTPSSPFGTQSSAFGNQTTTSAFGQSAFGSQRGGSRVTGYSPTVEVDATNNTPTNHKLESISAMPVYKDKSHEELRWEDYQLGDKGGPNPASVQPAGGFSAPAPQSNPFGASQPFGQVSTNPFSSNTSLNQFTTKTSTFGTPPFASTPFSSSPFGSTSTANPFGTPSSTSTANPFGTPSSSTPFGVTSTTPSLFNSSQSHFNSSTPSIFGGTASAPGTTSPFGLNFGNTQPAGLFQSTTPSIGQTNSAFGQTSSAFGQSTSAVGQSTMFNNNTPSTGFGFSTSSTQSLLPTGNQPSLSNPFQTAQPAQTSGAFAFPNFSQTPAGSIGYASTPGGFGQGAFGQPQSAMVMQPTPVSNPFGTLPAMPQISIAHSGSTPSIQYGISSMPVADKPNPARVSSLLLTSRHLSQRRISLPARKYHPKNDARKVPFYCDYEEAPSTPKADALFIPRENPRTLVICSTEKWPSRASAEKPSPLKVIHDPVQKNDSLAEDGCQKERKTNQRPNGVEEDHHPTEKAESYITVNGHRAGEAAIVYEHGADIEAVMPKLKHADYYTEPRIQELAAMERAEPGSCQHVRGFVVGRHGYGSIKFIGETDVRRLDLEFLVQFNNREVIVYMDDNKKPPVGQGLNKPAEVTLLNIKCFDKKSGKQYTEGPKVDRYKEMLMKKARDQGAEFVAYDPLKGEWRFRVKHFSRYSLEVEDEVGLDVESSQNC